MPDPNYNPNAGKYDLGVNNSGLPSEDAQLSNKNPDYSYAIQPLGLEDMIAQLNRMIKIDRYLFERPLDIADSVSIKIGGNKGTKIGTSTSAKIGFYNATPVVQQSGTGETAGFSAGAGTAVTDQSTFTGNVGSTAYRISDIVKALKNLGLLSS